LPLLRFSGTASTQGTSVTLTFHANSGFSIVLRLAQGCVGVYRLRIMTEKKRKRRSGRWRHVNLFIFIALVLAVLFLLPRRGVDELSSASQTQLLELARQQLRATAAGETELIDVIEEQLPDSLRKEGAAFVSLYTPDGALRGCMIDDFARHEPLYYNVLRNTVLAATADNRFDTITPEEAASLRLSISIVYDIQLIDYDTPDDLLEILAPGPFGIILRADGVTGSYLPTVWSIFPDPADFLTELCVKSGLAADRWQQSPYPTINTYRVYEYSE